MTYSRTRPAASGRVRARLETRWVLSLLVALAMLAAACGDDSPSTTTTAGVETADAVTTTDIVTTTVSDTTPVDDTATTVSDPAGGPEGTLRIAVSRFQFETLDPAEAGPATHGYWDPIYDYMFDVDGDEIQPGLVEEWSSSDDGLTWVFQVRQGVNWHNGRELDAEDIKWNFDWMQTRQHDTATILRDVLESVEVTGPFEVTVTLSQPVPLILDWLSATNSYSLVPREYNDMTATEWLANPIGSGPWRYVDHSVGEFVEYEAVEEHWRKIPEFEELIMRVVPEDSTRLAMLIQGDVDLIDAPLSFVPEVEASSANLTIISVKQAVSAGIYFTGVYEDATAPAYDPDRPWAKKEVREALNLAVDKQAIIDTILFGEGQLAVVASVLPWQLGWSDSWAPHPYDPERAKQLLTEAGYPDGFSLTVHAYPRPGIPDLPLVIEAVAADWARLGLDVEIFPSDWPGIARPLVRGGEADFLLGHSLGVFPPNLDRVLWRAPNRYFETSELINSALDALESAETREEVADAIGRVGDAVIEEFAWVPVAIVNQLYVANGTTIGNAPIVAHAGGLNHLEYVTHAP